MEKHKRDAIEDLKKEQIAHLLQGIVVGGFLLGPERWNMVLGSVAESLAGRKATYMKDRARAIKDGKHFIDVVVKSMQALMDLISTTTALGVRSWEYAEVVRQVEADVICQALGHDHEPNRETDPLTSEAWAALSPDMLWLAKEIIKDVDKGVASLALLNARVSDDEPQVSLN